MEQTDVAKAAEAPPLSDIVAQLSAGATQVDMTVRGFLALFGAQRRRYWVVLRIREALHAAGLATHPDFEGAYIDSIIAIRPAPATGSAGVSLPPLTVEATGVVTAGADGVPTTTLLLTGGIPDPTYRIGKLPAANRKPVSISAQAPLQEATTLMLMHDFSQLPVMQGERTLKGVVSWQSIGSRLALHINGPTVADFMDTGFEIPSDTSLFAAIGTIVNKQYVLIRASDNTIAGIVTTSDLSLQFQQLAEPFLLLGEIENHVRRLIGGRFTAEEVKAAGDPVDAERTIESVTDLNFGEYVRLLERPENWTKLGLAIDRAAFVKQLDRVREIRNDVMHFDPDPVGDDDLKVLRDFVQFLQTLQAITTSGKPDGG